MNTKKMLAATALVLLLMKMVALREVKISKDFLFVSILAAMVSMCGLFSVTYNNTPDYTYATYISSAWVWWGAAYTACQVIRLVHGRLTWILVINYLMAVCVFQCIIALVMDMNPSVKHLVNSIVLQEDQDFIFTGNVHRLYGIGASLDVAGSRFGAVLIMILFLLANSRLQKYWYEYFLYFLGFIIISIAGNMVARTTMVGLLVGLVYLAFISIRQFKVIEKNYFNLWKWLLGLLVICIPLAVWAYHTDRRIQENIRFGFEGFFNYFEKGEFTYSSNESLKTMYVWPDNTKTWIIGDGYFDNPNLTDPTYTGENYAGNFYKGTDVGYLRFIYYFGTIGLLAFSWYMVKVGQVCMNKFPQWKILFLLLLIMHFLVWAKVSTDIFLVFAMFLCLNPNEDENAYYLSHSRNI